MRSRFAAYVVLLLTLAFVALACGGDGDDDTSSPDVAATVALRSTATAPVPSPSTVSSEVPSGWKRFAASGIEIWLPGSYEGGEPTKGDLDIVFRTLRDAGLGDSVRQFQSAGANVVLLMIDNDARTLGTNVNIAATDLPSAFGLEAVVDAGLALLPPGFEVQERTTTTVAGLNAIRTKGTAKTGGIQLRNTQYFFRTPNRFWIVTFSAAAQTFDRVIATFEQSARTIKLGE
jgi:hypothetical protein